MHAVFLRNFNLQLFMRKYRTEWTIAQADSSYPIAAIQWYRGTIDMDNVHYCATELEAEREIDDAIISEQEMQIAKLSVGLKQTLGAARASRDTFKNLGIQSDLLDATIEDNERLLKQLKS